MIPKTTHYCWFEGNPKFKDVKMLKLADLSKKVICNNVLIIKVGMSF